MIGRPALFFDLFFTLVSPSYKESDNEYDLLNISVEEWEAIAEDSESYIQRATGVVNDEMQIIDEIITKGNFKVNAYVKNEILNRRIERMRSALVNVDATILETLVKLKNVGQKLCVVSNCDVIDVKHWKESPLSSVFDEIIFSCNVGYVKPNPKIYEIALSQMTSIPQKSYFIGDGGSDELQGAKKVGMTTVLTEYLAKSEPIKREELLRYADYHIDDFRHLNKIVTIGECLNDYKTIFS